MEDENDLKNVLGEYTRGDKTLEETNEALKELGSALRWTRPGTSSPPRS